MRVLRRLLGGGSFARARRRLVRKNGRCVFLTGLLIGVAVDCIAWITNGLFKILFKTDNALFPVSVLIVIPYFSSKSLLTIEPRHWNI